MGQAKRRGTIEQRIAQAVARDNLILADRNVALTKPLTKDETKAEVRRPRRSPMSSMLVLAALAALPPQR